MKTSRKNRIKGFAALPKSYFSLFTSTLLASTSFYIVGGQDLNATAYLTVFFFTATAFLNSFNNLMDVRSDSVTKKGFPIPSGVVSRNEAALFSAGLLLGALTFAAVIIQEMPSLTQLLFLQLLLAFLYSAPKIRLKRYPIIKASTLMAHTVFLPITMAISAKDIGLNYEWWALVPIYLMGMGIHVIQDIGDVEGDRLVGDMTFPVLLGVKNSVLIVLVLFLAAGLLTLLTPIVSRVFVLLGLLFQGLVASVLFLRPEWWKYCFWSCSAASYIVLVVLLADFAGLTR